MKIIRQTQNIDELVDHLTKLDRSFRIHHGTYSTMIETENHKIKFSGTNFSNRVFIAAKMVNKDILNSEFAQQIMQANWSRSNYANSQNLKPFKAKRILNIDISGAYASCLRNNNLITQKTFDYLQRLKKDERLPAVGMLARTFTVFTYECGEISDVTVNRSATAQIFFYLIAEISNVMQALQFELGKHFYFYWVDGVFFAYDTPNNLIKRCERILSDRGYHFKYELVENFSLTKHQEVFTINMVKNGDPKIYKFSDSNIGREITNLLNEKAKEYNLHAQRT